MMKKILIGLDGSVDGMNAADEAYRLGFLSPPAQVTLLGALHINRLTVHGLFGLSEEEAERRRDVFRDKHLTSYRQVLEERGVQVTADVVEDDSPAEAIARVAERDGHDLVVLGRQGLGSLKRMFVGSVTSKVLHLCERPVLVVPHGATSAASDKEKVIVAPTDFSPGSEAGLELAAQLAKAWSARLKLVHCSPFSELLSDGYAAVGVPLCIPRHPPFALSASLSTQNNSNERLVGEVLPLLQQSAKRLHRTLCGGVPDDRPSD